MKNNDELNYYLNMILSPEQNHFVGYFAEKDILFEFWFDPSGLMLCFAPNLADSLLCYKSSDILDDFIVLGEL